MDKAKFKEELIKKIYALEKEAGQLRKELRKFLREGEPGTEAVVITDTEDETKYHCHYKNIKGTYCSILKNVDKMKDDGCTIEQKAILLVESIPATEKNELAGYVRLGKSKTYVPQYLTLNRPHLKVARLKRNKYLRKFKERLSKGGQK